MKRIGFRLTIFVASALLFACVIESQSPAPTPAAPVPPAIFAAKKIFLANAGADSGLFPHPFSGNPDRAYNQFYAALKASDRWQLVSSPSDADLVLELRLTAPYGPKDPDKQKGTSDPLPMFRLVLYEAKSHYLLWALTEAIDPANLQKTHDRNFDDALNALVIDFKALTSNAPPPAN